MAKLDDVSTAELVVRLAKQLVSLQENGHYVGAYGEDWLDEVRSAGAIILVLDSREPDWHGVHVDLFMDTIERALVEYGITVGS